MAKKSVTRVPQKELDFAREKSGKNAFSENKNRNLAENSQNSKENHSFSRSNKYNNFYINTLWNKYQKSMIEFFEPYGVQNKGIEAVRDENGELIELVAKCDHFDVRFNDFDCYVDYNVNKRESSGSYDYMSDLLNWSDDLQKSFSESIANLLWYKVFCQKFGSTYPEKKENYEHKKIDKKVKEYKGKFSESDIRILSNLEKNNTSGLTNLVELGDANIKNTSKFDATR